MRFVCESIRCCLSRGGAVVAYRPVIGCGVNNAHCVFPIGQEGKIEAGDCQFRPS